VSDLHWLTPREFLDGVAISNLTPGPIAVLATFAGYRQAGLAGAAVATAALMIPSFALMLLLANAYNRFGDDNRIQRFLAGVSPAVLALLLHACVTGKGRSRGVAGLATGGRCAAPAALSRLATRGAAGGGRIGGIRRHGPLIPSRWRLPAVEIGVTRIADLGPDRRVGSFQDVTHAEIALLSTASL
jgi:hypothetical protein